MKEYFEEGLYYQYLEFAIASFSGKMELISLNPYYLQKDLNQNLHPHFHNLLYNLIKNKSYHCSVIHLFSAKAHPLRLCKKEV